MRIFLNKPIVSKKFSVFLNFFEIQVCLYTSTTNFWFNGLSFNDFFTIIYNVNCILEPSLVIFSIISSSAASHSLFLSFNGINSSSLIFSTNFFSVLLEAKFCTYNQKKYFPFRFVVTMHNNS